MANFFRILGIIIALFMLVGFGLCGLWGIATGISMTASAGPAWGSEETLIIVCGLIGLAISAIFGFAVRAIFKSIRVKPSSKP